MEENEKNKMKYISRELMLLVVIIWMGILLGSSINNDDQYPALLVADNNQDDEISAKLIAFVEFVNNTKSDKAELNRQYVNNGLLYLSGVLNAIIKNHYRGSADMNAQREKLYKINAKILDDDSLSAENLRESLLLSSKIISGIQSNEFPGLKDASHDLENSALEIEHNETFEVLKYKTADYFEKSSDIFIAMFIIKEQKKSDANDLFYGIRST